MFTVRPVRKEIAIPDKVFKRKSDASRYMNRYALKNNLHRDYFYVEKVDERYTSRARPAWENYFLGMALLISQRSHDAQTQHGCVIVDGQNRVLGTGYNGFPKGMKDATLPNTRPDKYDWMIHSEVNACSNCVLKPRNAIAFVTGEPCNQCLMHMWQNGVYKVVYRDSHGSHLLNDKTREQREQFLSQTGMIVVARQPDLAWLSNLVG